jgi:hypothetical protein
MCLVVRAWLILVGSKWNIKLGYLSDIALVLWWRGIFERMISTFWASKGWCRPFETFPLTFSHDTVQLALAITAIPGFFAYDYDAACAYSQRSCTSTETSLRENRFQDILSRIMSVLSCITYLMTSSSCRELTTFFAKKCTLKLYLHSHRLVLNWWVLRDIGEKWCEECYNIPVFNDLTELNEHLAVEIPPSARVYPCRHATAISIVVMCVDNNELKTMAKRTCTRLDFSLKA